MTKSLREERAEFDAVNREHATPIVQLSQDEYRALRDALAAAEAALARATAAYDGGTRDLLADKRRLDWLANNATYVQPGKPLTTLMFDIPEGKSLRAAIDDCAPRP